MSKPQLIIDSMNLIRSAGKITRQEYLIGMSELERKYPGIGFSIEMSKLRNFYEEHNLNFDEIPEGKIIGEIKFP